MNNKRNSIIILAKDINLDKEYQNIIDYSESDRVSLCRSNDHLVIEQNNYSFIKIGDNKISVGIPYATCLQANYIAMQNPYYNNKWFFAFIDSVEYSSEKTSVITYTVDELATWWGYWSKKTCYVEREHVNDDGYYKNLIDEGIPYGDYQNSYVSNFSNISTSHPVMSTTIDPNDGKTKVGGGVYGGVFSGSTYYVFQDNNALNTAIKKIASEGNSAGIVGIFIVPDWLSGYSSATFNPNGISIVPQTSSVTTSNGIVLPLQPITLNGYTKKNRKLFNHPYFCYVLSNKAGAEIELKAEDFKDDGSHSGNINVVGSITPGCSIRAIPIDYKVGTSFAEGEENEYGLTLGKFPICSYPVDMYTNWLTQNSTNIKMDTIGTIGTAIAGGVMLAIPGMQGTGGLMLASSVGSAIETYNQIHKESLVPESVSGNANSGDVTYANGNLTYTVYCKFLKPQYARMLDDFFNRFGYKVNALKQPNFTGRTYWNFVKICGGEIIGTSNNTISVPDKSMDTINKVFRNGTTIWHNHDNICNYSLNNTIVQNNS